jgi:hypothetical protein
MELHVWLRRGSLLCGAALCCLALAGGQASAATIVRPTITGVTASKVYEHEATLEAQINPSGSETTYEIWLECQSSHEPFWPCEPIADSQRISGRLAAGNEAKTVAHGLIGLQEGSHYWFGVTATNAAGATENRSNIFIVGVVPPGACPNGCSTGEQYRSEVPQWSTEQLNAESAQTVREYEARQRQAARELEEKHAMEAAVRAVEEAALKQREDEELATETARLYPPCIVPSLKGKTLRAARRALHAAHCRLGKVSQPPHRRRALTVTHQAPARGVRLAHEGAVMVTLRSP